MSENNIWKTKLFYITKTLAYNCLVQIRRVKLDKLGGAHVLKVWKPLTYSILTVLINQKSRYVFPMCSWCIFHRWQEFERLAAVAKLVLVLPHANADAERVFSVVGLNKTKRRNSLALDGTLSSIMTIKMANLEPCFKREPPSDIIRASKKATGQYNHAHKS